MKTHNEFMKEVAHETSLPVEAGKYVNEDCQSPSDLAAIKRSKKAIEEYREKFDADGSMVEGVREALSEESQTEEDLELISKRDAICEGGEK